MEPLWHAHLAPWNNDPIPFFWDGTTHLFLQHNPAGPTFGEMEWGHVSSTDLQNWKPHASALTPRERYDGRGVWTGCVVESGGVFYAFYTGIESFEPFVQSQCLATSSDLEHWERHPANPLIPSPPPDNGTCFRDPCVFRYGGQWRMAVGGQCRTGASVLQYRSSDLVSWEYLGPLWQATDFETGFDAECLDFFELDGRWVLLCSRGSVHWQVGTFDGSRFVPTSRGVCDGAPMAPREEPGHGFAGFYAAKTLVDDRGRRLLYGWATGASGDGWRGMIATPRELSVVDDRLRFGVPEELRARFSELEDGSAVAEDGPLVETIDPAGHWTTSVRVG